jgi:hypothetical protein
MYFYNIGGIVALFECHNEKLDKWKLTIYKIGSRGAWNVLGQKTKAYKNKSSKNPINHFKELRNKIQQRN